jgi:hypothetical protein
MKMKRQKITLLFGVFMVIVVIASCGIKKMSDVKEFKLERTNFNDWTNFLEIKNIIQLQESDQCLMSSAKKCFFTEKHIIYVDYKANNIYSFSYDGKFEHQVGRMGHSGSEYVRILDICMDTSDSVIMVLDGRGIVCYDANTGNFLERKKFHSPDYDNYLLIEPIRDDSFICFTYNDKKNSMVLDYPNGQINLRKRKRYNLCVNFFYRYNGECRIISDYGDFYIDSYKDGKLTPLYRIDLGGQALPNDILPKTFEEFMAVDNSPKFFKCITSAYETREWLWLRFVGPKQTYYTAFVNKQNGKYAFGEESMDMGIYVIGANKEYFYALIYPEFAEQGSLGRKILEKHNITKNSPVVVKLKLNENILQ